MRSIRLMKQMDVSIRSLFERAQLTCSVDEFLNGGVRTLAPERLHGLNAHALLVLSNLANRQDGRPAIQPDDWAMLIYCLMSSRTLRDAITRTGRFYRMLEGRWGSLGLFIQGGESEIRVDSLRTQRNTLAFVVDTTGMASLHGIFAWLIAQPIPLTRILLDYRESLRPEFDSTLLPYPLQFEAGRTALCFSSEYLDYPVVRTLDDYEQRMGQSFLFDLPEDPAESALTERARRILYSALRKQRTLPTLDELSVQLECSRARLRRELAKAGASYNLLKDSCRRELALDLLHRSRLSVEEVAVRLGFCDSDAFRRAFRHWMDMSPLQFRKQAARAAVSSG